MDFHKTLYKDQRSHTPRKHNDINRKVQQNNRAKNRRDRFQNSRNILLSPDRRIEKQIPICMENKENMIEEMSNTNRLATIISNTTNPEKLAKQEAFIKRFREWKEAKKNLKVPEKKKPFVNYAINSRQTTTSSSLVPRGHHKGFRPPVGLEANADKLKVEENKDQAKSKGRQSIYIIVPTPPRKHHLEKSINNNKGIIAKKTLPTNLHEKLLDSNKTQNGDKASVKSASKPRISSNKGSKPTIELKKRLSKESPHTSTAKNAVIKISKTLEKAKSKTITTQQPVKKDLRPRALKMPPPLPPSIKPISSATKRPLGAAAKIRSLAQKNSENTKPTKKSPLQKARLAQNLKAKKPLNNRKANLTVLKINGNKIVNIIKSNETDENMVIQTPRDFATINPFSEFVTSTKVKESSQNINIDGISPIERSPKKLHCHSSAKRKILGKENDQNNRKAAKEGSPQNFKRFNFIRYSEAKNVTDIDEMNNGDGKLKDDNDKAVAEEPDVVDKTPTKCGPEERPPNYLSPFVSVTRGKVSLKKEKEKRDSIYLQNNTEDHVLPFGVDTQNSPKYSVEVKRTLEAIRYFRKQLQEEIDRLHKLCDIWEAYKEENLEKVQNANGEDMINVTIGQTRLLTSKKFMQFKGLIDRCEAGTTGIGYVEYDGSEDTKPITSIDLEGFWSMLGLQVDNLDKRFENLNRWKANDWVDPEEVKPIKKNNITKVKKPKAVTAAKSKPTSALQQMLRKMQAEMKKNKNINDDTNEIVVLTSAKPKHRRSASSNNSTPRKSLEPSSSHRFFTVTVKDRKYFSPAATVISFSPNRRASPKLKKSLQKFNNDLDNLQVSDELRKSVLINENLRRTSLQTKSTMIPAQKRVSENSLDLSGMNNKKTDSAPEENNQTLTQKCLSSPPLSSPVPTVRKSILKTPGTAKSRLRNVIFNEKLRVKKFNFLINDKAENEEEEEANDTHEEVLAKCNTDETLTNETPERTLTLRNRKVRLRPSCEIVIPKN